MPPKDLERADRRVPALSQGGSQSGIGGKLYALVKSRLFRVLRVILLSGFLATLVVLLIGPLTGNKDIRLPDYGLIDVPDVTWWRQWTSSGSPGDLAPRYNLSAEGPVRMVVLGMPDLASGSGVQSKGWTDTLCIELGCSSFISMVPDLLVPNQAVSSYDVFQPEWDAFISTSTTKEPSGQNYHFLTEQYPLDTRNDLTRQVKDFLARPKPATPPPRETIWVISLGSWDIWTMASLPRETAKDIAKKMIDSIFDQIDVLYDASLNPDSIAYSNFWRYQPGGAEELADALRGNDTLLTPESFRFVIPEIADLTMTPGWDLTRPEPPEPHRRDDHMAMCSFLRGNWNTEVKLKTAAWNKKPPPGEEDKERASGDGENKKENEKGAPRRRKLSHHAAGGSLSVPYPRRQGLQVDAFNLITDSVRETEMREQSLSDALGRGRAGQDDPTWYENTREACAVRNRTAVGDTAGGGGHCEDPEQYLFFQPFQVWQRAVYDIARATADSIAAELFGLDLARDNKGWFT